MDGIELIVPKSRREEYQLIVDKVGDSFDLVFEHEKYDSIYYKNVNNYLAVFENGKTKQKGGIFITNPNIGDSCNALIVPKALEAYFVHGITVEEFMQQDSHSIFDFCLSQKVSKEKYDVYYMNQKQQQLNRYYVSKSGAILYKKKKTKKNMDNMLKGWGVKLYNNHDENMKHDIDYRYYIQKTKETINNIQRNNQMTLF